MLEDPHAGQGRQLRVQIAHKEAVNPKGNYRNKKSTSGVVEMVAPEFVTPPLPSSKRIYVFQAGNRGPYWMPIAELRGSGRFGGILVNHNAQLHVIFPHVMWSGSFAKNYRCRCCDLATDL